MKEEIIIAGFGGQGVLSMGRILAYSGLMEGKEVTWMPAYGPEQRGGTANVTVIVSDEKISSPILSKYDAAIILNVNNGGWFASELRTGIEDGGTYASDSDTDKAGAAPPLNLSGQLALARASAGKP